MLLLDTWQRSGLPASDFGAMVGLSKHTLYAWKARFDKSGPEGLLDQPKGGPKGSKLADITKRTILMLKERHPEWGCRRISDMLLRGPALPASESSVARVLHEAGYQLSEEVTEPHPDKVRRFERAKPNQLWQTDLFTFMLKRQNRRVYLVAFMDDHSRFIVSYGLHASQSGALVLEVLRAGIASYGAPQEILTDNGSAVCDLAWPAARSAGNSRSKASRHVVAKPHRPQTLGKVERFWGTLWRECLSSAVFVDLDEARKRIGLFVDHYNFQRPHQGIDGLVPADRFFGAAPEVLKTLQAAGGRQRPGTGPPRGAQAAVLHDRPGRRQAVRRACRGREGHPDGPGQRTAGGAVDPAGWNARRSRAAGPTDRRAGAAGGVARADRPTRHRPLATAVGGRSAGARPGHLGD